MKGLERFPEPWCYEKRDRAFVVKDANGFFLLGIGHRDDLHQSGYTNAGNYLSGKEALILTRAIVQLPVLWRRPQY